MEDISANKLAKQGQTIANLGGDAVPAIRKVTNQALALGKQGIDAVSDAWAQARDTAVDASDSIVAYTKKNPVKALAFAAASGALLYAIIQALTAERD